MALKDIFKQIRDLADAGFNEPEETGDVVTLRTEIIKLRGLLRGTYHAAELLNNKQIDPRYWGVFRRVSSDHRKGREHSNR